MRSLYKVRESVSENYPLDLVWDLLELEILHLKDKRFSNVNTSKCCSQSFLQKYYQCIDILLKYNFVETSRKFIIAELAIINLRGVSTKLYFNLIFIMQTYKELIIDILLRTT